MDSVIAPIQQSVEPVFRVEEISGRRAPNHSGGYGGFVQDTFELKQTARSRFVASDSVEFRRVSVPWWMPVWVAMELVVVGSAARFLLLLNGAL